MSDDYDPSAIELLKDLKPVRKRPEGFIAGDAASVSADRDIIEVIGDVHGEADLLEALLNDIEARHGKSAEGIRIVFLGDIVDRGPESTVAMMLVTKALEEYPGSVLVMGNHDQLFLDFLNRGVADDAWLKQGGYETLTSYDIPGVELSKSMSMADIPVTKLRGGILFFHPSHYDMLALRAAYSAVAGPFLFVHAGVHPNKMLGSQRPDDMMWIRDEFLNLDPETDTIATPGIVVHGHTTVIDVPEILSYRVNLDTGCGKSKSAPLSMMTIDLKTRKLSVRQALGTSDDVVVYPVHLDRMTVGDIPWLSEDGSFDLPDIELTPGKHRLTIKM